MQECPQISFSFLLFLFQHKLGDTGTHPHITYLTLVHKYLYIARPRHDIRLLSNLMVNSAVLKLC